MRNTKKRDAENAIRVKRTAEVVGVSIRTVERVIKGEQINEKVLEVYMFLQEGEQNLLLEAVEKAVPFN